MSESKSHPFDNLSPDLLIDAVESAGFVSDGRLLALNSYENRVYQVGIEDETPMIAKFYRPDRWSREQILEEHEFCFQLVEQELPVVPPWCGAEGNSLSEFGGFSFALFQRKGGRAPELDNLDNLFILGRLMGRIHGIGATKPFKYRPKLDSKAFGWNSYKLISEQFIPEGLRPAYDSLALDIMNKVEEILQITARLIIFASTATATLEIFSGAMITRILSILTIPAWRLRFRIYGCCCPVIVRSRHYRLPN